MEKRIKRNGYEIVKRDEEVSIISHLKFFVIGGAIILLIISSVIVYRKDPDSKGNQSFQQQEIMFTKEPIH